MKQSCHSILIVDDDQDDHFFLRTALSEVLPRAFVKSCYDGSEAITYLEHCISLPNIIFLDLNMQRTSGKTVTNFIRKQDPMKKLPVIILTSGKNAHEKKELVKLGASDFYTKPNSIKELIQIVNSVKNNWLATA